MKNFRLLKSLAAALLFGFVPAELSAQCSTSSTPTNNCSFGDVINTFSLNNVASTGSNNSCSNGYNSINQTFSVTIGQTYPWTAAVGGGNYQQGVAIWIDLNNNNSFDNSEMLVTSPYATSHSSTITIPSTATAATVKMRVRCAYYTNLTASDACTNNIGSYGETEDFNITLVSPCLGPVVMAAPQNQNFCVEGSATFGIVATSAATYRWQVSSGSGFSDITDNGTYSGATTNTLTISDAPANFNNNKYRCKATSSCGTPTTSTDATLTIFDPVSVKKQTNVVSACEEAATSMYISANGPVTGYQWQYGTLTNGYVNVPAQYPFTGTTDSLMEILYLSDTLAGINFRCIVYGPCKPDTSNNIGLQVALGPYVAQAPVDDTVQPYQNGQFEVEVGGTQYGAYWQSSVDGGANFVNINDNALYFGSKTTVLTVNAPPASLSGMQFRCIIKSTNPDCGLLYDTSDAATLYVGNFTTSVAGIAGEDNALLAYPNPATNMLYLSSSSISGSVHAEVIDNLGRVVKKELLSFDNAKAQLPVATLPSGAYTLRLTNSQMAPLGVTRFVKQ